MSSLLIGGAVAQLGERLVRNEEVRGSNPLGSTIYRQIHWFSYRIAQIGLTTILLASANSRSSPRTVAFVVASPALARSLLIQIMSS